MTPRVALFAFSGLGPMVGRKLAGTEFSRATFYGRSSHSLKYYSNRSSKHNYSQNFPFELISLSVVGLSSLLLIKSKDKIVCYAKEKTQEDEKEENWIAGKFIEGLPVFKLEEVEKHKTKADRIWVTYKNGVYDVTEFVEQHPGGSKLMLAAGGSLEPFWMLYAVHNSPEVHALLETLRIGNVSLEGKTQVAVSDDPYSKDPKRHPVLIPAARKPFNAEPPPSLLVDKFLTPNEIFYVRNHLPVPDIKEQEYMLEVSGLGVKTKKFTLKDLKKFPKHSVKAALQCAGNRRSEMIHVKPVKGLKWNHAAIGNAKWSGARLQDVLKACGYKGHPEVEHVQFEGYDTGPDGMPYGGSVPAHKVFDPSRHVLLAYEMNDKELSRDHGYPVRVIIPGIVGARNVKWLSKIILSDEESYSFWQTSDYKGFNPSTDWDTVDFSASPAIQDLPVNSAICTPEDGEKVQVYDGCILVRGYAWSGGGNEIVRVDVTTNKGEKWYIAELDHGEDEKDKRWSWTLWSILIPVDTKQDEVEIWVKAVDASYNTQPETFDHIWNLRGLLSNAYHKVKVELEKD